MRFSYSIWRTETTIREYLYRDRCPTEENNTNRLCHKKYFTFLFDMGYLIMCSNPCGRETCNQGLGKPTRDCTFVYGHDKDFSHYILFQICYPFYFIKLDF